MPVSVSPPGSPARVRPLAIARALLSEVPEAQRLALVGEMIRDAADPASRLQLRSLARLAEITAAELDRAALIRREAR